MTLSTYLQHFVVANTQTFIYCCWSLFIITLNYIKKLCSSEVKLSKLEPPACLSDPKYGTHKYLKINGLKLHYVESGDPSKPLMILLHGYPEIWYSWRYQILEFQRDYWCIAVDMRGFGDSEKPEYQSSYKIDLPAADIRDLIRQLGREKCILIGHDWGGIVACHFRDVYPEALDAVITIASTSRQAWYNQIWSNPEQFKMSWYVFLYRAPIIPECLVQMNNLEFMRKVLSIPNKTTVSDEDIECYTYWFGKKDAVKYPINYYRSNFAISLQMKPRCDREIPMLAALADGDIYLSKKILDELKKEYKYIDTTIVEGCGHFMQQEEPDKTNKLIRDFLHKHNL